MDLYSSDLRLSDIGLDPQEREFLAQEYPLGMLDEEEENSDIYNPYSPGSPASYDNSRSNNDILSDVDIHRQMVDRRGTLMEIEDSGAAGDVEGILDVLNTAGTSLHWIDSFLQGAGTVNPCDDDDETSMLDDEDILASAAAVNIRKSPRVKSEHSYSLANTRSGSSCPLDLSLIGGDVKLEDVDEGNHLLSLEHDDVDVEGDENGLLFGSLVDDDSEVNMTLLMDSTSPYQAGTQSVTVRCVTSLEDLCDVKPDGEVLDEDGRNLIDDEQFIEYVKAEPEEDDEEEEEEEESCSISTTVYKSVRASDISDKSDVYGTSIMLHLPPTPPPSSGSSSDSDSCLSPSRSPAVSPVQQLAPSSSSSSTHTFATKQLSVRHNQNLWTATIHQPTSLTSTYSGNSTYSSDGIGSQVLQGGIVGSLFLTEEEKRTLLAEGYPLPAKLPLTKQEEKNLKKIRRKIKNKISAQESRRKKKEYLETLEKKVDNVSQENNHLKKKVDILETNNRSLISQLQRLQTLVNKLSPVSTQSNTAATTTCVLVS